MSGGGTSFNMPQQPTYGEGMADAMKAQMEMLTGAGEDFGPIYEEALGRKGGRLQDVLREFEAPLRKETAQIDTDVMRQTLLGGEAPMADSQGRVITGYTTPPGEVGDVVYAGGEITNQKTGEKTSIYEWMTEKGYTDDPDTSVLTAKGAKYLGLDPDGTYRYSADSGAVKTKKGSKRSTPVETTKDFKAPFISSFKTDTGGEVTEAEPIYETAIDPATGEPVIDPVTGEPQVITDDWLEAQGKPKRAGTTTREGTGMLDLFGPKEAGMVTRERTQADIDALPPGVKAKTYEGYVDADVKLQANYQRHLDQDAIRRQQGEDVPELTKAQFGEEHFKKHGRREGRKLPEGMRLGETMQVERRAGFDPATNEFLGLTTLGADVSEQLARRQRAADIYDVEQLGGKATEAYRQQGVQRRAATLEDVTAGLATEVGQDIAVPGTGIAGALATARGLGPGGTRPATAADVTAGLATTAGESIAAPSAYREDPLGAFGGMGSRDPMQVALQPAPGLQVGTRTAPPTRRTSAGALPPGGIQALQPAAPAPAFGQPTGTELLRGTVLGQVQEGLGQGLTEREQRTLREASRARAVAMGRTYDPKSTIDELKIQMMEDEGRRARNLAQAQSVLGGEVGIQQTDLERQLRQAHMGEQLRQAGLGQERAAAASMVGLEQATGADPFQAILGRPSGAGAAMGQQMFGQAGYGLQSAPQYLNPEAGLGYISQAAANEASMWGAQQQADAARSGGFMDLVGSLGSAAIGLYNPKKKTPACWVAREVYGAHNPAWLDFREWMLLRAPSWFRALYIGYGERFAKFISDKPRLKARIRGWMDTKIGRV